ncbi:MAG: FAD-dependent oxidoreductase [Cyanobacteria bacterium J06627_8]
MPVDYNLVILGGSLAARYAAALARCFQARVALIEPQSFQTSYSGIEMDLAIAQTLQRSVQQQALVAPYIDEDDHSLLLQQMMRDNRLNPMDYPPFAQLLQDCSLDGLAAKGVDVIIGRDNPETGEFCRRPHLGVVANRRTLRSHAYLVAPASTPIIPSIPGLSTVPYLTTDTLLQRSLSPNSRIAIIGQSSRSIEFTQALAQAGMTVTLIIENTQFQPEADWAVAQWTLTLLESLGVTIVTGAKVTGVEALNDVISLQVEEGNKANRLSSIHVDHLIVTTPRRAELSSLNLEAVNLHPVDGYIPVRSTLRTSHRRIYACGEAIAPLDNPAVARYQAECAVKNALFLPTRRWSDRSSANVTHTIPSYGHVGLTEKQAKQQYHQKAFSLTIPLETEELGCFDSTVWNSPIATFLTVIVHHNGTILGAHCTGQASEELLALLAMAIHQQWLVERLSSANASILHTANPSTSGFCANVLHRLLLKWESERVNRIQNRRNRLELLMNWRRDWSRG